MARQILALTLVLIALFVMVSADIKTAATTVVAATPDSNGDIGHIGKVAGAPSSVGTVEGPVGSAVAGAISGVATGQPPSSAGATMVGVTAAVTGAAPVAGYFVF
ncbi:hypothetical protein CXB51_032344 [Gossypium anomalum]|uniref:Anther-specific protein BCP1 n=1 Tax=Gossypium anomalum TaxID=47600 RepID=A0A8J6CHP7_9ROSI|nr:hypothetical protein CXB51_032344 [Gossypium anomalum]